MKPKPHPSPQPYVIGCVLAVVATSAILFAASLTPAGHSRALGFAAATTLVIAVILGVRAVAAEGLRRSRGGDC